MFLSSISLQVNVDEIVSYAFSGSIENIEFVECRIGTIRAFAINCVSEVVYNVSFDGCVIDRIDSQAFKNMRLQHFTFRNTMFVSPLVNRAFYRLSISDNFSVMNCTFDAITAGAIQMNGLFMSYCREWQTENKMNFNFRRESLRFLG